MTVRIRPQSLLHLVMPDSVSSWFRHFVRPAERDRIVEIGEAPGVDVGTVLAALESAGADTAIMHSSHDTLVRDQALADALTAHGYAAVAQSDRSIRLGVDKLRMKEFFDEQGFAHLPWLSGGDPTALAGNPLLVIKARQGTQSRGTILARLRERPPGPSEVGEHYADGVEYSVVVFRYGDRVVTFPPIWKGPTSPELVPPWRRLRLCPYQAIDPRLEHDMRSCAKAIAVAADCVGLMEVEYLVTEEGQIKVLEINPRVSGTMRLAAMATGIPIFSIYGEADVRGDLVATGHAAEIPYQGEPISDPERGVFATSRLTVVASDPDRAIRKLRVNSRGGWAEPALAAA